MADLTPTLTKDGASPTAAAASSRRSRWTTWRRAPAVALVAVLVVVAVAYAGSLRFGFLADARMLISDNRYLDSWSYLGATLTHDYFWSSSGSSIPYWRPLTKLSWLVEAQLFGRGALPFHALQLAWLLVAVAGVWAWARSLGVAGLWAAAAALLFGLHPALAEPGCLLMARSDVTVTACMLWSLVGWRHWTHDRRRAGALVHVVALVLALASKETAVIVAPACSIWLLSDGRPTRRQLATLLPAWLMTAGYLILRRQVVGAVPGAAIDPLRLFDGVGAYAAALVPFRLATGLRNLSAAEAHAPSTLLQAALAWLTIAALTTWALVRRQRWLVPLLATALLSLLPVLMGATPYVPGAVGKYALADRWLMSAAAASSVALAAAFARLSAPMRRVVAGAVAPWALAAVVVAPAAHSYYASDDTLLDLEQQQFVDTPERYRTVEDSCRARERAMARAIVSHDTDAAVALARAPAGECPVDASAQFNLLSALVQAKRYAEARPLVAPLMDRFSLDRRFHGPALFLSGVTYLHTGEPARAEELLAAALREGVASCALFGYLADAAAAQAHAEAEARWRQTQRDCAAARRGR